MLKMTDLINIDKGTGSGMGAEQQPVSDPIDSNQPPSSFALFDALKELSTNNGQFYATDDSETGQRLHGAFIGLIDHVHLARDLVDEINSFVHVYDFDAQTPGNGYRSFLMVVQSCIEHSIRVNKYIMQNRSSLIFRKSTYMKEIEACCHLLASLCTCLQYLLTLREWSDDESLFPSRGHTAAELFNKAESINQYCFYGRCLGVQYCESMRSVLRVLAICMAGFSEAYYGEGGKITKATNSMWTTGTFYWNPELRARRIVNISQNASIDFCKSFWSLAENELMHSLPSVIGTSIKINKIITIPPEPIQLPDRLNDHQFIDIPIPTSHIGPGPISARLLSYSRRQGMFGERTNTSDTLPPSPHLIFHCHGGGFVAQSSRTHEIYLREWATALNCPILSIDYSLAPAAPFPRAIEEVFYAYCWTLRNFKFLGTTGERIVMAGDSAGANINLACTLRAIQMSVRIPDGVFISYCPVSISFDPSPARILCLMDPLLPFGFMMRCLKAYACPSKEILAENQRILDEKNRIKYTGSPVYVTDDPNTDSDLPTFVHIETERAEDTLNSMWEHIEADQLTNGDNSDCSDTFASASIHSQTMGNTELMTPDESNGISFEEDSQPITIHKPFNGLCDTYDVKTDILSNVDPTKSPVEAIEIPITVTSDQSEQYVNDFMERYVLDTEIDSNGREYPVLKSISRTPSEDNVVADVARDTLSIQNFQERFYKAAGSISETVQQTLNSLTTTVPKADKQAELGEVRQHLDALIAKNPTEEFDFMIPRDPLLSPYWMDDETLKQLPSTKILSVDMDPCLDDCVMFAKRLKRLNHDVTLDVLHGLPHGFLNFVKLSKEAHDGNKVCIKRLAELLQTEVQRDGEKKCC